MKDKRQKTKGKMNGYTLIEVLMASAMFVGVLVIATGTFSTANRIRETAMTVQQTTDTARFISETLARDIRAATGTKTGDLTCGQFTICPYDFLESGTVKATQDSADGLVHAQSLQTNRFDSTLGTSGGIVTRTYTFSPDTAGLGDLTVTVAKEGESATPAASLLPTGLKIKNFEFRGLSHQISDLHSQPFAQYQFTVVNTATNTEQTVRSSVTSRELL